MNKSSLSHIQLAVVVVAALYVIMPDMFFGPIDDAAVAAIAAVAEVVLGIIKSTSLSASGNSLPKDDAL